jgi:hypothetical protein
MNCPYCDETIHPQAKFCAKCGLPLKEDTTVQGVSATDDAGPSKYVIGALLGGIGLIAILIVWLGGQKPSDTQQARQPAPPVNFQTPGMGNGMAGTRPSTPAFANAQPARATFAAPRADANTTSATHYVYTPPARLPVAVGPAPDVTPPPVPLLAMTTGDVPRPGRVTVVRSQAPAIPSLPDSVASAAIPAMPDVVEPAAEDEEGRVNPNPRLYVWDPVQERWARRPDAPRRRATTSRTRRGGTAITRPLQSTNPIGGELRPPVTPE